MAVPDFKEEIIRARQRGATQQAIANRYGCTRQRIQNLLCKWGVPDALASKRADQAREAIQLLIDGQYNSVRKAGNACGISETMVSNFAKKQGIDLAKIMDDHRADRLAHSLDGRQFNGLSIVNGTCQKIHGKSGQYLVDAICVVCGNRKTFHVSNLRAGYSKTCSISCGRRFSKGDYLMTSFVPNETR